MIFTASWSSEQNALSATGVEVIAVATGVETVVSDPMPLLLIGVDKGVGIGVAVGMLGISVGAGRVGHGVRVGVGVGISVNNLSAVDSISGSSLPPQATSSGMSAGSSKSSDVGLIFISLPIITRQGDSAEQGRLWKLGGCY